MHRIARRQWNKRGKGRGSPHQRDYRPQWEADPLLSKPRGKGPRGMTPLPWRHKDANILEQKRGREYEYLKRESRGTGSCLEKESPNRRMIVQVLHLQPITRKKKGAGKQLITQKTHRQPGTDEPTDGVRNHQEWSSPKTDYIIGVKTQAWRAALSGTNATRSEDLGTVTQELRSLREKNNLMK